MSTKLKNVQFFNSGYCRQLKYFARGFGRGLTRFQAVFVHFQHPQHGSFLIDTGYGQHFFEAVKTFPERFYSWITPVHLDINVNAATVLADHNIDPSKVSKIFVSHFHADHIASLRDFPKAKFVYAGEPYQRILKHSRFLQVKHAFLKALLPDDFESRGEAFSEKDLNQHQPFLGDLKTLDYFGDGSFLIIDLPGHADGHLGYYLNIEPEPILYAVDAFWHHSILERNLDLPFPSRGVQFDYKAYKNSIDQLKQVVDCEVLACHCPKTQDYITKSRT